MAQGSEDRDATTSLAGIDYRYINTSIKTKDKGGEGMNENLNLVEILKDCPKGTKLYSTVLGEVEFEGVTDGVNYPIIVKLNEEQFGERIIETFTSDGMLIATYKGECVLFPSRDQRDWSKFNK